MALNRAMPTSDVIPILSYTNVGDAVQWLCETFGFSARWRAGSHRAKLNVGNGCVVVTSGEPSTAGREIMVRVKNADAHHLQARNRGTEIVSPPTDFPYGERQNSARYLEGYAWTFSQSIADVDPVAWGAQVGTLSN